MPAAVGFTVSKTDQSPSLTELTLHLWGKQKIREVSKLYRELVVTSVTQRGQSAEDAI